MTMSKAEEIAKQIYPDWELTSNPKFDGQEQSNVRIQRQAFLKGYLQAEKDLTEKAKFSSGWDGFYYGQGYKQAEKDLLENKHETSWRLDEKFWEGIKDIEEASYQYMYDASNDWAYDIPTWKDVQDAFKAGSEWKKGLALTWKDIADILDVTDVIANNDSMEERLKTMSEKEYYQEVLKRFSEKKALNNKE